MATKSKTVTPKETATQEPTKKDKTDNLFNAKKAKESAEKIDNNEDKSVQEEAPVKKEPVKVVAKVEVEKKEDKPAFSMVNTSSLYKK